MLSKPAISYNLFFLSGQRALCFTNTALKTEMRYTEKQIAFRIPDTSSTKKYISVTDTIRKNGTFLALTRLIGQFDDESRHRAVPVKPQRPVELEAPAGYKQGAHPHGSIGGLEDKQAYRGDVTAEGVLCRAGVETRVVAPRGGDSEARHATSGCV